MLALALLGLAASPAPVAQDLALRLAAQAELGRHAWVHASDGGLELALQTVGAKPPAEQAAALARELAGPMGALAQAWGEFATQLELPEPQRLARLPAVVVLGDDRAHAAWLDAHPARAPFAELALHDAALDAVVTRVFPGAALAPERREAILRAAAGAWLDRAASAGALSPSALREGLAGSLVRAALEGPRRATFARADAERLAAAARVPKRRLQTLPGAAELWAPRDAGEVRTWVYERARDLGLPGAETETALECFYAQARAWCDWLGAADDERRRAGWTSYLQGALAGTSRFEALCIALGVDGGELEREFLDVLLTAGARDLPVELVGEIVAERGGARASARGTAADFDPAELAPSTLDPRVQLALALTEAREGALAAAGARLEAVVAIASATREGERAVRERERLAALEAARLAWAENAAARGSRLAREVDGKRVALKVERFEGGLLHFARNRLELETLPLEGLRPEEILSEPETLPAGTPAWVAAWVQCLAGEERWTRALEGQPERAVLEADGADVPALLGLGATARTLQGLAQLELAGGVLAPADAERALGEIANLLARGNDSLIDAARPELARLAELALGARHDALGGIPSLAGRTSPGPAGSVRVHYAFDAALEADDFLLDTDALAEWHATMTPVPKAPDASYFVLRQGAFFGDGQLVYRHRMRFRPPVRVKYVMRYVPRQEDPLDVGVVMWGLGGTSGGTFAAASEFGDVYVTDPGTGHGGRTLFEGERVVEINTLYTCEARLEPSDDGFTIEAWREGALRNALPARNCDGGELFLFVHTPRIVALEELTIEGVPDPTTLAQLRAQWIEREREKLGL
jgi:hypothetical protein